MEEFVAAVAELVDAPALGAGGVSPWGFESLRPHAQPRDASTSRGLAFQALTTERRQAVGRYAAGRSSGSRTGRRTRGRAPPGALSVHCLPSI